MIALMDRTHRILVSEASVCDRTFLIAWFFGQVFAVESCANPLLGGAGVGFLYDWLTHPALRAPIHYADLAVIFGGIGL
jgi:hypothetical protein